MLELGPHYGKSVGAVGGGRNRIPVSLVGREPSGFGRVVQFLAAVGLKNRTEHGVDHGNSRGSREFPHSDGSRVE